MRAIDAAVAQRFQSSDGRQVGHAGESNTILPFAFGSHFTNSVLSLNFGRTIASAATGVPLVPGLHASIVPSSDRTRGATSAMFDVPRRQPRHVPYCSRFASMPQALYCPITQLLAARIPGLPVSRGPIESNSVCASFWTCELSMPRRQMRWMFGSSVGNCVVCAASGAAPISANAPTAVSLRNDDMNVVEEGARLSRPPVWRGRCLKLTKGQVHHGLERRSTSSMASPSGSSIMKARVSPNV